MSHKGEAYSASGAIFLDNPIRRMIQPPSDIIEKLAIKPDQVVLDFGCGPGFFTIDLAKKAQKVVAVDISSEMLNKVRKKAEKNKVDNIQFLQSDGKKIELKDSTVDLILLVTVYHEVGEHEIVLKEFGRILKPNGKLSIVEVIKKSILPGAPLQKPETLKSEIEAINYKLETITPYKNYGILIFSKKS